MFFPSMYIHFPRFFAYRHGIPAVSLGFCPLLLFSGFFRQTYCNSRENRVYYRQRLRKAIVFRVWIREMPVGARHTCGSSRRDNVSTFQAAGEEPEVRVLYRTVEWFRFLSEQFGWQHGAYSSHTMVDGYAFFIPGEEFLTLLQGVGYVRSQISAR